MKTIDYVLLTIGLSMAGVHLATGSYTEAIWYLCVTAFALAPVVLKKKDK